MNKLKLKNYPAPRSGKIQNAFHFTFQHFTPFIKLPVIT